MPHNIQIYRALPRKKMNSPLVFETSVGRMTMADLAQATGIAKTTIQARRERYGDDTDPRILGNKADLKNAISTGNDEWLELCRNSSETEAARLASVKNIKPLGVYDGI